MSMRDEFESHFAGVYGTAKDELNQYVNTDTDAAWGGWQAAREQGAEPVAYLIRQEFTDRLEVFDHRDKGRDPKYYGSPFAVYARPQSAGVPEAIILRKQAEAVERLASHYSIKSMSGTYIFKDAAIEEADRLRQQANELEQK